jgi:hypothetical protein
MYSREQMSTRLKLGTTLSTPELALVVKTLFEKVEELQTEINNLKNLHNESISTNKRGTGTDTGKNIQASSIQSGFKL